MHGIFIQNFDEFHSLQNTFDFLYSILYSRNFSTLLSHCLAISIDPSNRSICKIEEKITRNIVQLFVNYRFPRAKRFLKELQLFIGTGFLRSPFLSRLLEDKKKKKKRKVKKVRTKEVERIEADHRHSFY